MSNLCRRCWRMEFCRGQGSVESIVTRGHNRPVYGLSPRHRSCVWALDRLFSGFKTTRVAVISLESDHYLARGLVATVRRNLRKDGGFGHFVWPPLALIRESAGFAGNYRPHCRPPAGIVNQGFGEPYVKWTGPGLNRRHQDFQSCALPTELPVLSHCCAMVCEHRLCQPPRGQRRRRAESLELL